MEFRCNGGACPSTGSYQVQAELRNNSSILPFAQDRPWTATGWFTVSDAPHTLELCQQRV